ncbi:MAG TPA: lamin tail domain-containing protein [Rubricoccaceae bacterium]|jgi:hypothetical protein
MRLFVLSVVLVCVARPSGAQQPGSVVITEILVNPEGVNDNVGEWFELYNTTSQPIDLQGWVVQDYTGPNSGCTANLSTTPHTIAASVVLPPYGFAVLGNNANPAFNGEVPVNYSYGTALALINSADGVLLYAPGGTTLVDKVCYQSAAASAQNGIARELRDATLDNLDVDGSNWVNALFSSRYGTGGYGTPGAGGQTAISAGAVTSAAAGWRLLAAPLPELTVGTLAGLNLVQGVSDEFPTFGANLYTGYTGNRAGANGGFTVPSAKADPLVRGRGFFWYMYAAGGPGPTDPRGTSSRADLPLTLLAQGFAPAGDDTLTVSAAERAGATDQFYVLGNPFNSAFDLSGLTTTSGTLSEVVQLYVPAAGYLIRTRIAGVADGNAADDVAVWQGFMAEFFAAPALPFSFAYDEAARTRTVPPFSGRPGGAADYAHVGLALDGTMASGAVIHDEAASLYFSDLAGLGWDPYDASKLPPMAAPAATIAPIGPGPDGAPRQLAQRSFPLALAGPVTTPVGFTATEAGTYTFSVPAFEGVPATWAVTLTDHETGATTALGAGASYSFTSGAVAYSERFSVTVAPGSVTGTEAPASAGAYVLTAVAPNPSDGAGHATLLLRDAGHVRAEVFDVLGRRVQTVFLGPVAPGVSQPLEVASGTLPPGAYVLRVTGADFAATRTFSVVR